MTLTRANVESILVERCGTLMSFVSMAVTFAGANADLNDPIGYGIRQVGGTVTDVTSVDDDDVATVGSDDYDALFDCAEYRLLNSIVGNLSAVDLQVGPRRESFDQIAKRVQTRADRLLKHLQDTYGLPQVDVQTGKIILDFADHNETIADG